MLMKRDTEEWGRVERRKERETQREREREREEWGEINDQKLSLCEVKSSDRSRKKYRSRAF